MKRTIAILFLSLAAGMISGCKHKPPSPVSREYSCKEGGASVTYSQMWAVASSETCRTVAFETVWKAKVAAIMAFNKAHPDYVKKHNLTRDMSAQTRRLKEQARKSLERQCAGSFDDISAENNDWVQQYFKSKEYHKDPEMATEPSTLNQLIEPEEYPVYVNPEVVAKASFPDQQYGMGGLGAMWWSASGVAIGPGDLSNTPIAPTPEPSSFVMLGMGLFGLAWNTRPDSGHSDKNTK